MITELSRPIIDGTHEQVTIIIRADEDDSSKVAVRVYPMAKQGNLTDEQVGAISKGYLLVGSPAEIEDKMPGELSQYADAITDGASQLAEIQAEIEKAKKPKPKAQTKAKAKPKAKTNAEKVADQRKKQMEEAKKAKEGLQDSLDLGSDRLDEKTGEEDILAQAEEMDI